MKISLDPRRDRTRLAHALHAASWMRTTPWADLEPRDRREFRSQAARLMRTLSGLPARPTPRRDTDCDCDGDDA